MAERAASRGGDVIALTADPSPLWYFARAAGFVSLMLLAVAVATGLVVTMRWRHPRWPTFVTDELHTYLVVVSYVFIVIHVLTILLDPFTGFSLADVLVPFVSTYRSLWMGLGICAFELSLALGASVYLRRLIGYRAWRVLHYGTYAVFPLVLAHGLGAGSDTRSWWAVAIYALSAFVVITIALVRAMEAYAIRHERVSAGAAT
jgi:sulfoxide reductase heme-binding subunit YedZ